MAGEYDAGGEWHCEPLVRIDSDGVAALDAADQISMRIAEYGGGAVSSVEMKPQILTVAEVGEGGDVIDGAGVGSSCGGDDAERLAAGGAVFADCELESA